MERFMRAPFFCARPPVFWIFIRVSGSQSAVTAWKKTSCNREPGPHRIPAFLRVGVFRDGVQISGNGETGSRYTTLTQPVGSYGYAVAVADARAPKIVNLRPHTGSDFPDASGSVTTIVWSVQDGYWTYHMANVHVEVWGLAPNCVYGVYCPQDGYYIDYVLTDASGNGAGGDTWQTGHQDVPSKFEVIDEMTGVVELSN